MTLIRTIRPDPIHWQHVEGREFEYRGYSYKPWLDDGDPEVRKLSHDIHGPTGSLAGWVQHSPYSWPDREAIEARIDELIKAGVVEATIPRFADFKKAQAEIKALDKPYADFLKRQSLSTPMAAE